MRPEMPRQHVEETSSSPVLTRAVYGDSGNAIRCEEDKRRGREFRKKLPRKTPSPTGWISSKIIQISCTTMDQYGGRFFRLSNPPVAFLNRHEPNAVG